jgi:3-phosphoshikimate 1-carboxyvinyltransferase
MTNRMVAQFAGQPADYAIEGDATAASYFAELAVVTDGSVDVHGLNLAPDALQGDIQFYHLLTARGLIRSAGRNVAGGLSRQGVIANFNDFSDTFLSLAALAPLLDGPTKIAGIAHTRKQETDRVAGMARELTKLGQHVVETEDALEIHPRPLLPGVEIETYHDHRFAMSFGILGCHDLHGDGRPWLTIKDPACCAKTFPAFFDLLAGLRAGSH